MHRNFHIYKSSAGSGKTYTLVKEYLKIVLREPSKVRHILAITFTNAAAAEMKERIIRELGQISSLEGEGLSQDDQHPLVKQIVKELQDDEGVMLSAETIVANARIVLKGILHTYGDFSVSTIDSFVHRVIRTFSFDLFLPFHFDVELDDEALLSQATDLLIGRAGRDKQLTDLLVAFIIHQADEEKDLRIENLISNLGKTLMAEDADSSLQRLKDLSMEDLFHISKKIKEVIYSYENNVRKHAREALELIHKHGLEPGSFYQARSGICKYFQDLATGSVSAFINPNSYVRKTIDEDKWVSGKAGPSETEAIQAIKPQLQLYFEAIAGKDLTLISNYKTYQAVGKNFFQVAVLNELDKVLEEVKTDKVMLHISDFNKMVAAIVAEQPVPFIYERLGERYHHYMVDEFQDTSCLQWQNLLPLIDNSLAGGHFSMVVGDGKQAIYRFRNGDVEQFARLPELTTAMRSAARQEWEQALKANCNIKHLGTNYRSERAIVDFNNRFFSFTANHLPDDLQAIYLDATQQFLPSKNDGYVEIRFLSPEAPARPVSDDAVALSHGREADMVQTDGESDRKHSFEQLNLDAVSETIEQVLAGGHALRDITILCHSNAKASLIARDLLAKGVPVISSESLLLNHAEEVNFILSFIRLLADQFDQVAAVDLLGYLMKNNWVSRPGTIHECIAQIKKNQFSRQADSTRVPDAIDALLAGNGIPLSFRDFFHLNLYDICEHIIRVFFAGPGTPNPFVAFFSDALYDYSEKNASSVHDFLSWWEEKSDAFSLVLPDGVDAVRIMTIHKSKGLQFPVVIVPFADHSFSRTTKNGQWVDVDLPEIPELKTTWVGLNKKELENTPYETARQAEAGKSFLDTLNMVYVAFTRPVEKLFVFSKMTRTFNAHTSHGLLHKFLKQENLWQEDQLSYSFGTLTTTKKKEAVHDEKQDVSEPEVKDIFFEAIVSQPWSRMLRMKSHQAERSLISGESDVLERGNLLHRAMEKIYVHADVQKTLQQMLEQGEIDTGRMLEWNEKIMRLIQQEAVAPYFQPGLKVMSEAGIFDEDGQFYRPDRIVITAHEAVIMDYKTGRQYARHLSQMALYGDLLHRMGYQNVKKLILYLDENKINTV